MTPSRLQTASRGAAIVVTTVALLSGCAADPPAAANTGADILPRNASWRVAGAAANAPTPAPAADARWWQAFDDPHLGTLVSRALASNADVRMAIERVAAARALDTAAASRLWPRVEASLGASQTRTGVPDAVKQAGMPDTLGIRGLVEIGWEVDLFGAAGAASRAVARDADAALMSVESARLLVASEVARQYIGWQAAQLRHRWLRAMLDARQEQLRLLQTRRREGVASDLDISRAEAELADLRAQADLPLPQMAAAEARLALLLHLPAGTRAPLPEPAQLNAVAQAPAVPAGQPIDLLRRRPDVRAAEQQMLAEGERLDEARANLWPRLVFGASIGRQDLKLNALDLPTSLYRNLLASFSLPLFNAGRLQAQREGQAARLRSAQLAYEKAALAAVTDVEASLALGAEAEHRLAAHRRARAEREHQVGWADSLLRAGQIDRLQRLDAERALLAARLTESDSMAALALARVQLHAAMGGGWQLESRSP